MSGFAPIIIRDHPGYASGDQIAPDALFVTADTALNNAARIFLTPAVIPYPLSITSLGAWVATNGVGAGHVMRFGVYRGDRAGRPLTAGGLLLDGGTIDLTAGATGQVRPVAVSATLLPAGIVWLAAAWNVAASSAATVRTFATASTGSRTMPSNAPLSSAQFGYTAAADHTAAMPTTLPALTVTNANAFAPAPVLGVA